MRRIEFQVILILLNFLLATLFFPLTQKMLQTGPRTKVIIGSRESELAMIQSRHIQSLLAQAHPTIEFSIVTSSTLGDEVLDKSLSTLGTNNPGLFTKNLEAHIVTGRYDLAVHSLKDMPTTLPDGLVLCSITEREDPTDALVCHPEYTAASPVVNTLADLPPGAVVGTSSLRRQALIGRYYPHLIVKSIRGNLNTRMAKLDQSTTLQHRTAEGAEQEQGQGEGEGKEDTEKNAKWVGEPGVHYDAIVLATAGLKRMGWQDRISNILHAFPYGISQGALGIETRTNDDWMNQLIRSTLSDVSSTLRCLAERSFLRSLQGGCQVPIGARSELQTTDEKTLLLTLEGIVLAEDGSSWSEAKQQIVLTTTLVSEHALDEEFQTQVEALGVAVADEAKKGGAEALLGRGGGEGTVRPITYSKVATGN